MGKKLTQEEIIKRFEEVHGDKYDYSKVNYINSGTKVNIICPEHGEFLQTPSNHLKYNCPKCSNLKKSIESHIKDFKKIHGDKYDYSKVQYINTMTKVEIICPKHGSFFQTPMSHKSGNGCPKCSKEKQSGKLSNFLKTLSKEHFDKYDYSKVNYTNRFKKIEVICKKCNKSFWCIPNNHLKNNSENTFCPNCYINKNTYTKDKIISDFKKIHGDKYDYSKVQYINTMTKVEIICPEHGSFFQRPNDHRNAVGCPKCAQENSESKGERKVREFLEENNIKYSQEVNLFNNYRFDFYLEDLNTVIEYDGKQHFEPVDYFGGLEGFLKTQERDKIKTEYCLENNIRIIRIAYFEEVEEVLEGILNV